jgi:hypothetical protein
MLLKWVLEAVCGGVDWIEVTQDRVPWEVFVNMATEPFVSMQYFGEANTMKFSKRTTYHFVSHYQTDLCLSLYQANFSEYY